MDLFEIITFVLSAFLGLYFWVFLIMCGLSAFWGFYFGFSDFEETLNVEGQKSMKFDVRLEDFNGNERVVWRLLPTVLGCFGLIVGMFCWPLALWFEYKRSSAGHPVRSMGLQTSLAYKVRVLHSELFLYRNTFRPFSRYRVIHHKVMLAVMREGWEIAQFNLKYIPPEQRF